MGKAAFDMSVTSGAPPGRSVLSIAAIIISSLALACALLFSSGVIGFATPNSTTGETGAADADGTDGAPGATGETGVQGAPGAVGKTGQTGASGPAGATGPRGSAGATGADGPRGSDGSDGPVGLTGATGPAGADGADGAPGPAGPAGIGVALSHASWVDASATHASRYSTSHSWRLSPGIPVSISDDVIRDSFGDFVIQTPGWYRVKLLVQPSQTPYGAGSSLTMVRLSMDSGHGFATLKGATVSDFTELFPKTLELTAVFKVEGPDDERVLLLIETPDISSERPKIVTYLEIDRIA